MPSAKHVDDTRRLEPDAESVGSGGRGCEKNGDVTRRLDPDADSVDYGGSDDGSGGEVALDDVVRPVLRSSSPRAKKRVRATGSVKDLLLRRPPLKRPCKACRSAAPRDVSSGAVTSLSVGDDVVNAERCDHAVTSMPSGAVTWVCPQCGGCHCGRSEGLS